MANKAKRFPSQQEVSEQPGPGQYSIQKKSDWIKEVGRIGPASAPAGTGSKDGTSTKGSVRPCTFFSASEIKTKRITESKSNVERI